MSKELVELVKANCAGLFFEASIYGYDPTFGVSWDDANLLYDASMPWQNFPRWRRYFLPEPLKHNALDPNSYKYHANGLYAYHYPINKGRLKMEIEEHVKTEEFFIKRGGKAITSILNVDEFMERFNSKFSNPACIYTNILGGSVLLGNRDITQNVMDYFKANSENVRILMRELVGFTAWAAIQEDERWQGIHLYDLIKSPKEVHFPF